MPGLPFKLGADARDLAAGEGDVGDGVELLRGSIDAAAAKDEIVGHGGIRATNEGRVKPSPDLLEGKYGRNI